MKPFNGISVRTYSTITAEKTVRIDAAAVRAYETLYGEIYFTVEGREVRTKDWAPISREYTYPADALAYCREVKRAIECARKGEK